MKEYNKFCSTIFKITKHTAYTRLRIGYNLIRKDCTIFEVYYLLFLYVICVYGYLLQT
jgi:hypothetical protein